MLQGTNRWVSGRAGDGLVVGLDGIRGLLQH